jgi:hypothetical protein
MKSRCNLKRSSSILMKDFCYSEQYPNILMHSSHLDKTFKKYVGIQTWISLSQPLTKIYFHFLITVESATSQTVASAAQILCREV